ncbi:AMP-binding protein [Nakamurella sp. YIM 132087]|uniref:AMP-binding protein n=1 Tax=Nakamurella alba TaxID=2665158 RepID=A0A7K1FSM0_9ACTN|nr:long-chain fatty acid--CoA ligase [Nakamurella alba]MTD17111.1 AMP-binding protein [Nakamurella alba]
MNVASFLEKSARQWGENPAYIHGAEQRTYTEFLDRVLRVGGGLRALGLAPGDRVAFVLQNSPRILETIYACFAAGLVVVPVNARLHPREIAYIAENSGARVLVYDPDFAEGLAAHRDAFPGVEWWVGLAPAEGHLLFEDLATGIEKLSTVIDVAPTDPCWLFYTSGTTGRPKGATWSHRTATAVLMNYLADVHPIEPGEVVLHAAPMSHGSGIVAMPAIARGATNAIMPAGSFSPNALFAEIERLRVGHIAFVAPTQIIAMLDEFVPGSYDLSSLRAVLYGGAPIYVEQLKQAIETFGPVFVQIYGQGEAPITISWLSARQHAELLAAGDARVGSAGITRTDVEARIVDADDNLLPPGQVGEIVARGDMVMLGYWNNPEATAETMRGGWLHTGDIGMFDEKGYLFLLDRAKDVIISGGNNVYPREVEEVITQIPGVANCVVLGIPHDYWGEAVHAVVMPERGRTFTEREIIEHCAAHLAGYKKPKSVEFMDELPLSGYGKVQRRELREKYWEGSGRRIGGGVAAPAAG